MDSSVATALGLVTRNRKQVQTFFISLIVGLTYSGGEMVVEVMSALRSSFCTLFLMVLRLQCQVSQFNVCTSGSRTSLFTEHCKVI